MTEQEIKAAIVKAMDDNVSDDAAKAAFAGVLAHAAFNLERIAVALERLAPRDRIELAEIKPAGTDQG
jgi:hypothetical protein